MSSSRMGSGDDKEEIRILPAEDAPGRGIANYVDGDLLKAIMTRFPEDSRRLVEEKVRHYEVNLIRTIVVGADRSRSKYISPADVERAFLFLNEGRAGGIRSHFGQIGGALLGTGLSCLAGLLLVQDLPPFVVYTGAILSVIGAFLIAKDP